jgi:hypothetical protein
MQIVISRSPSGENMRHRGLWVLGTFAGLATLFVLTGPLLSRGSAARVSTIPRFESDGAAKGTVSTFELPEREIPDAAPLPAEESAGEGGAAAEPLEVGATGDVFDHYLAAARADSIPITYRVCKDLTICQLSFASPAPGVVLGTPSIPPVLLTPVLAAGVPTVLAAGTGFPWWLLAMPATGVVYGGSRGGPESNGPPANPPPEGPPANPPPDSPPPENPPESPPTTTVPEPATMVLLGSGLAGLAGLRRRRNRNR